MGLFDFFQRARERRAAKRAKKLFASYVDPALVDYVMANPQALSLPAREARIDFLLAVVADDNASQLPASLRKAAAVLEGEGALLEGVMGSLLFATFKSFSEQKLPEPSVRRARAVLQGNATLFL